MESLEQCSPSGYSCHHLFESVLTACWLLLPLPCVLSSSPQGSDYISSLSLGDEHDCGNHTPGGSHSHSMCSAADMDPAMREAVVANAAAAAVTAFASAAAATSSGGGISEQPGAALPPAPPSSQPRNGTTSDAGEAALGSRQSGTNSPPRQYNYLPGRPPSFHDLARAMREFHEQQMAEMAEARSREAAAAAAATPVANGVCHGVGELGSFHSGTLSTPLDSPPLVEVKLPNGASLNPTVLAKVAATAATAAASALNEVMPQRNGQQPAPATVCTIASYSNCKEEHS